MEKALSVWNGLDIRRRTIVAASTFGVFVAVLLLARMAATPNMALLYSGLEPAAAGDVVAALEAQGAPYEVRGAAIFVDSAQRDSLRLTLAGDGLPAAGAQGYELLDSLSGFGTTSQMFDAAYWRAKEGELARTIVAARHIEAARVHIANPGARPFARADRVTASVTVTTATGTLSAPHAKALRYLVASAVPGLSPEDVSIIDSAGGLVSGGTDGAGGEPAPVDRAEALRRNAERLLEARVGYGNAVVEVSVDTVTESESITERRFDPDSRFAIATDSEERVNTAADTGSGAVTVASNLPDGDAGGGDRRSSSNSTETRERVNYEVSETQREVTRVPGDVRRLSVAVLVDGLRTTDAAGAETWAPRSDAELADLRELVASAVGFDQARGDTITIKSLEFEPLAEVGTAATAGLLDQMAVDAMSLVQMAVLAVVALVLGLFVLRPILASRTAVPDPVRLSSPSAPARPPALTAPRVAPPAALDGEIDDGFDPPMMPGFGSTGGGLAARPARPDDAVARLRRMIEDRQDETVELLRSWMDEPEGRA